jgi:aminoglycoside phosphotransferase (APT) family kinase protein
VGRPSAHAVRSDGTDNVIFRLGDELALRLPRHPAAAGQAEKEHRWLPELAPLLPLPIPAPVAIGRPAAGYSWRWGVCRWLPGVTATPDRLGDARAAAADLARFVRALQSIDAARGPLYGDHNFGRGAPLAMRDGHVRAALAQLEGVIDTRAAGAAWEAALETPPHDGPPAWVHGDLQAGNLLADRGRLGGVIDFGALGVGDPACDVMAAWIFVAAEGRDEFRTLLDVDDATWERARGWALSVGLIALPYYGETNRAFAATARRWIEEALSDRVA